VALPLQRNPKKWSDFEEIRWFLTHEDVNVFVDDGDWYLLVQRTCKYLRPDNMCGIYETRPYICREYSTDKCEYDEHYLYEKIFEHDAQLDEYAEALLGARPPYRGS
jgi:Fe-S-cluster containining protein